MPSPERYAVVKKMLESKGYFLHRCKGSHYRFLKPAVGTFTVLVQRNLVKVTYVRRIERL